MNASAAFGDVPNNWFRLLYKSKISDEKSEARWPSEFFFSPQGESNFQSEFAAEVKEFSSANANLQICKYPARYKTLVEAGLVPNLSMDHCTNYSKFKAKIHPDEVFLMFASSLPTVPSSAFGHLFLRFHSKDINDSELTDWALNYGANGSNYDSTEYILGGAFGHLQGGFKLEEYYLMIRSYSKMQSRDLFSYKLNLSNNEIDLLIDRIWEFLNVNPSYNFFTHNCATHLALVLDSITKKDFYETLPVFIIPERVVNSLIETGNVIQVSSRSSLRRKFESSERKLNFGQLKSLKNILERNPKDQHNYDASVRASAALYYDFELFNPDPEKIEFENNNLDLKTLDLQMNKQLGYRERRIDMGVVNGSSKANSFARYRFALSDKFDSQVPSFDYRELELGSFGFYLYPKFDFKEFVLVSLVSEPDFMWPIRSLSWKFSLRSRTLDPEMTGFHDYHRKAGIDLGVGISKYFGKLLFHAGLAAFSGYETYYSYLTDLAFEENLLFFSSKFRIGIGAETKVLSTKDEIVKSIANLWTAIPITQQIQLLESATKNFDTAEYSFSSSLAYHF